MSCADSYAWSRPGRNPTIGISRQIQWAPVLGSPPQPVIMQVGRRGCVTSSNRFYKESQLAWCMSLCHGSSATGGSTAHYWWHFNLLLCHRVSFPFSIKIDDDLDHPAVARGIPPLSVGLGDLPSNRSKTRGWARFWILWSCIRRV